MKRFIVLILLILAGCASAKPYMIDRSRDAADVFTITTGLGLGAKARLGPFSQGLYFGMNAIGLQCGEPYLISFNEKENFSADMSYLAVGVDISNNSEIIRTRDKRYEIFYLLGFAQKEGMDEKFLSFKSEIGKRKNPSVKP